MMSSGGSRTLEPKCMGPSPEALIAWLLEPESFTSQFTHLYHGGDDTLGSSKDK